MNQQAFLARIARPLPQVTRAPHYVRAPTRPGELVGWYVELDGQPVALGSNIYFAQARLEQLLEQAQVPA